MIEDIIKTTIDNFDFSMCIAINVATYIVIKAIDELNGDKPVPRWLKRIIFILCSIIITAIYVLIGVDKKIVLNSIIIAPISWSWVFKPICKKLGVDYKTLDKINNQIN